VPKEIVGGERVGVGRDPLVVGIMEYHRNPASVSNKTSIGMDSNNRGDPKVLLQARSSNQSSNLTPTDRTDAENPGAITKDGGILPEKGISSPYQGRVSDENAGGPLKQLQNTYDNSSSTGTKCNNPLSLSHSSVFGEHKSTSSKNTGLGMLVKPKTSLTCLPPLQDTLRNIAHQQNGLSFPYDDDNNDNRTNIGNNTHSGGTGLPQMQTQTQILPPSMYQQPEQEYHHPYSHSLPPHEARNDHCSHNIYALQSNGSNDGHYAGEHHHFGGGNSYLPYNNGMNTNANDRCIMVLNHPNNGRYEVHQQQPMQQQQQQYQGNNIDNHHQYNINSYGPNFTGENYELDFPSFHAENKTESFARNNENCINNVTTNNSIVSNNANSMNSRKGGASVANTTANNDELPGTAYRMERIEKQRLMMASGGSLFVTSPRSFLMMGWNK